MTTGRVCYVCKGYVYGKPRHPQCEPAYRRIRAFDCEVCGQIARGRRHRRCEGFVPKGYNRCGYCLGITRGRYHNTCHPETYEYSVFLDMPGILQRRCVSCHEWFPFASIEPTEDVVNQEFAPRGRAHSGRSLFQGRCRACMAQARRDAARAA